MASNDGWTVENNVGRLVEVRVLHLGSAWDVERFSGAIQRTASAVPHAIIIVDLRSPIVFPDEVAEAIVALMVRANKVRERTAILLSNERAILSLQLVRLVKRANDSRRQTFIKPDEMLRWISEPMTEDEKARAKVFVRSGSAAN